MDANGVYKPTNITGGHHPVVGGVLKWRYPNSWMVYSGKYPSKNGWFGGTTMLGNLSVTTCLGGSSTFVGDIFDHWWLINDGDCNAQRSRHWGLSWWIFDMGIPINQVLNMADFGLPKHGCIMLYITNENQRLFPKLAKMDWGTLFLDKPTM